MAFVKPFRGIRYNSEVVKDLSRVICPPYDVISPSGQEDYHRLDKYNYIRIEHSQNYPQMMKAKTNTPGRLAPWKNGWRMRF
jgi:uncharacterized protein (DUF1015 family)